MNRFSTKLLFDKYNKLNKKGQAPIYVQVYLNGLQYYYKTQHYIEPNHWDKVNERVKRNHPNYRSINSSLNKLMITMEDIVLDYDKHNQLITYQTLKGELSPQEEEKPKIFFEVFFLNEIKRRNDITPETRQNHYNTLNKLHEFRQNKKVEFEDLTFDFVQNFEYFLTAQGLQPNSRRKQHNILQSYINRAIKQDLLSIDLNPYKKFTKPKAETNRIALSKDELQAIIDLAFESELAYMYVVKDIFLFSCATALRFSDTMRLSWKNIYIEGEETFLKIKMQKTGRWVDLPLDHLQHSDLALSILEKYKAQKRDKVFPKLTLAHVNRVLKDIAKFAKIDKPLTSHIARHTFGTLGASKLPPLVLRELMGHSKVDTTMIYVKMSREQIKKELKNVNWDG